MGRRLPGVAPEEARQLVLMDYLLRYAINSDDEVEIAGLLHGHRDLR
jgi:hypothetical protein